MINTKQYYGTLDRSGTEDEISIRSPDGKCLAFIWFSDDGQEDSDAACAKAAACLIVDALNVFDPTGEKSRHCETGIQEGITL